MPYAHNKLRSALRFLCCALFVGGTTPLQAQETKQPETPPGDLVRQVVAQEVVAASKPDKHLFRSRKQIPKGSQTRLYVETNEALAGMLVAINDRPLSTEQKQQEEGHLAWLINNPDQLRKKRAREKEDTERTLRVVRALPDAFR